MKKILFSLITIISLSNYSCRKEDNPVLPDLQDNIPVTKFVAEANSEVVIDMTKDPAAFKGKFNFFMASRKLYRQRDFFAPER